MISIFLNSWCNSYRAKNSQVSAKEKVRNLWVRVLIYDLQSHFVSLDVFIVSPTFLSGFYVTINNLI